LHSRPIVAAGDQALAQIGEARPHAIANGDAFSGKCGIISELRTDVVDRPSRHIVFVNVFNDLPRRQSDHDTEDDDADLAGEGAPAVQRLGYTNMHSAGSQQRRS